MDIIVLMKQVVDLDQVRIKPDTREPLLEGLPFLFGGYDKCALEAALQLREQAGGGKVTVVAGGHPKLRETVKEALAMGADEAVLLLEPPLQALDTTGSAKVLAGAVRALGAYDLILAGASSTDDYTGQVPSRLAQELGLPQAGYARALEAAGEDRLRVERDLEQALEVVEVALPALVTVVSEINSPRLPPLTAILKAARKPVRELTAAELGLDTTALQPTLEQLSNLAPAQARKNIIFEAPAQEAAAQLIQALRKEGVVA